GLPGHRDVAAHARRASGRSHFNLRRSGRSLDIAREPGRMASAHAAKVFAAHVSRRPFLHPDRRIVVAWPALPSPFAGLTKTPPRGCGATRGGHMNRDEQEDTTIYCVVVNHEEQYSIWPEYKEIPLGWRDVGKHGPKAECLEYIKEVWTDMRPLSL